VRDRRPGGKGRTNNCDPGQKGVVLAAGGFEHNASMREEFLPKPVSTEWTSGAKGNTGEVIRMGMTIGAAVDLMDDAWWGPVWSAW